MPRFSAPFLLGLACLLLAGCEAGQREDASFPSSIPRSEAEADAAFVSEAEESADPGQTPSPADTTQRVLIRTAYVTMEVGDVAEAQAAVVAAVARYDGYVAGEAETRDAYRIQNTLTLRIASHQYEALMAELLPLARRIERREVRVRDVTAEYVDLDARRRARRDVERQYLSVLARAQSVEDVLRVQTALAQVREEIERAEGQLRLLSSQATYSTVEVTLFEPAPGERFTSPGFFSKVGRAFGAGWQGLLELLVVVVALWPLWLVGGLLAVFVPRLVRRRAARPFPPPPAPKRP